MRLLPFSLLISNGSFGRQGPCCRPLLSFSVRLAMSPVERERTPSGCRASGLTPELPLHAVAGTVVVGYTKAPDFTRAVHRIVQSTLLFSIFFAAPEAYKRGRLSDGYTTMDLNKTPFNYCSRHN